MDVALEKLAEEVPHLQHSFDSAFVVGSGSFGLTQYILWMIICFIITLAVVLATSKRLTLVPTNKFVNMVEYGYEFVKKDMGESAIGHGYKRHIPFLATLFFFILISNFVGLIPGCKTPTGSLSVTWALAAISFVYFIFWGIKTKGGIGYLKSFAPSGLPIVMVPIVWFLELFSTVLRVLTLAVRLYGNMFAGHMVLGIFALLTSVFIGTAIQNMDFVTALPAVAWMVFLFAMYALEVLVAFLQAYVFTILSAVYIGLATEDH
ncbi:MAG: F0F1 ATP synthase subunit A [Raoultibacter sp.]